MDFHSKTKKAYSLVEVLISLGVLSIIIVMLFNTIIISFQLATKIAARSSIREEMTSLISTLATDIRMSDSVLQCDLNTCDVLIKDTIVSWSLCQSEKLCRKEYTANAYPPVSANLLKQTVTSDILIINTFTVETIGSGSGSNTQKSILITMIGEHSTEELNISNIVRQTTVSTKNYEI